jgi:hypothetical protein
LTFKAHGTIIRVWNGETKKEKAMNISHNTDKEIADQLIKAIEEDLEELIAFGWGVEDIQTYCYLRDVKEDLTA